MCVRLFCAWSLCCIGVVVAGVAVGLWSEWVVIFSDDVEWRLSGVSVTVGFGYRVGGDGTVGVEVSWLYVVQRGCGMEGVSIESEELVSEELVLVLVSLSWGVGVLAVLPRKQK